MRIAILDDEPIMLETLSRFFVRQGWQVATFQDPRGFLAEFDQGGYDIVLTDHFMPQVDGMQIVQAVHERFPDTVIVMMTGFGSIDSAVQAMRLGAFDYLTKPFQLDHVQVILDKAVQESERRTSYRRLQREVEKRYSFYNIIARSAKMQRIFDLIQTVAKSPTIIIITGKSGTGKELIAKAIHYNSERRNKPFVALNCTALPDALLESELFGHVKGAFTGATHDKEGLIQAAEGGTLFLDEIGDLSPTAQLKMLRFLQEKEIRRVGDTRTLKVDVRIIAATNQDLEQRVKDGVFREDLYYRLCVINIVLPDLRERQEDIPLLVSHFVNRFCEVSGRPVLEVPAEVMSVLMDYPWPGNVRELENTIERLVMLTPGPGLRVSDLPERMLPQRASFTSVGAPDNAMPTLEELERRHIMAALDFCDGNKTKAAKILGLDRRTLYRKLEQYGLEIDEQV